jgi:hypothetical protein
MADKIRKDSPEYRAFLADVQYTINHYQPQKESARTVEERNAVNAAYNQALRDVAFLHNLDESVLSRLDLWA